MFAGRFTDLKDGGVDLEAQELRERLCTELVPSVIPPSQLYSYNVPWDGNKGVSTANEDQNRSAGITRLSLPVIYCKIIIFHWTLILLILWVGQLMN
ncbi:hypothetical protein DPMN_167689 [Dreissena polymorpha]|uniref:Uncharacterized protein n=1 Tax=Dreissena polymorpha TaxID=45954 RepID=A0A9D4F1V7_DREPO|nr:hypothetical protein DPMN_167689 [Dreissena polymorpha]